MTSSTSVTLKEDSGAAPTVAKPAAGASTERLVSLDAFRGAIMLLMASSGFGIPQIAKNFPDSPAWKFFGDEFDHTPWTGCTLWDLIQPAFMFMVGVALPWSIANRWARGQGFARLFSHAIWRALLLVLLAVFLTSASSKHTEWIFTNVLAQIGLGYPFLFLLYFTKPRTQWLAAFSILFAYWLAFALHPLPSADFDWQSVGVPADWPHLTGFAAHWDKNANFAAKFDLWFLNLFPREAPFIFNKGGYQTLNFVPSLVTMIFGMIAGRLLRSDLSSGQKVIRLVLAGLVGIGIGAVLHVAGVCPIVKRIWTSSYTLYSGGLVILMLAAFYAAIELRGWRRWCFPLLVIGANSIAVYVMSWTMEHFVTDALMRHVGLAPFSWLGAPFVPVLRGAAVLLVFWSILFWMYRRKIFVRI